MTLPFICMQAQGQETATFSPADKFAFSASSGYLVVTQTPGKSTVDSLKILKTKEDKMPMNTLVIYSVAGKKETIDSLKTFKLADEADWIAYQRGRKDSTLYVPFAGWKQDLPVPDRNGFPIRQEKRYAILHERSGRRSRYIHLEPGERKSGAHQRGKRRIQTNHVRRERGTASFLILRRQRFFLQSVKLMVTEHNAPAKEIATRGNKAFPLNG